ncbi:class I SAM-dependent methyltransferase [Oceanimonas baumannii]|uniref:class I SAM-dependent methyltransferase n=1 Tax=Oceanimonas baumannii TaxID=129578 RepID=UPI003A94B1BA
MQYQSFPGVKGGSASSQKLTALRLPSLKGKRFLDVGCNEGFFCGYALFEGASHVIGMDKSAQAISKATARFPDAEFLNQSWDTLPEGPFDVITLLSALHYAEDQEALIHHLVDRLSPNGLLVLEIGIAPNQKQGWVKIERAIDERWFPTRIKLGEILKDYAWKVIGHSVMQAGDPLPRYVVHIRKLKPYVWLLMQDPATGKSTITRQLFSTRKDITVISGDRTYLQITEGRHNVSETLRALVTEDFSTSTIGRTTKKLFQNNMTKELAELWAGLASFNSFALDSYIPESHRSQLKEAFAELGYFPVELTWEDPTPLATAQTVISKARQYEQHLLKQQTTQPAHLVKVDRLLSSELKSVIKFHIDSPAKGEWFSSAEPVNVSGWSVTLGYLQTDHQIYITSSEQEKRFTPSKSRPDVLSAIFGEAEDIPEFWQQHPCGFSCEVPADWLEAGMELGLIINNARIPLTHIAVTVAQPATLSAMLAQGLKRLRN